MAPAVEISIPSAQLSSTPKPYTVYNISLRLPLRSFTIQKRYSDFTALHGALISQAGAPPPASVPAKSWFSSTLHNPELTEQRRKGLESYLRTINETDDARWRDTSAWRTFLNLPSSLSSKSSAASTLHSAISSNGRITDPVVWLDCHRDLKVQLHNARLHLTQRDQASNAQAQHESGAQAKKCLVKAGTMIASLDQGLKSQDDWGSEKLGEGEVRRRRDLISSARKEKETLEFLLNAMVAKSRVDATVEDTKALITSPSSHTTTAIPPNTPKGTYRGHRISTGAATPDPDRGATDLVMLAGQDFTGEPVARVHLPVRVPLGFHGNWIGD